MIFYWEIRHFLPIVLLSIFASSFSSLALGSSSSSSSRSPVIIDLTTKVPPAQQSLIDSASELLETANISYAMGGSKLGDEQACNSCNECLAKVEPKPKQRFSKCPVCVQCSLDCSHFTQLVFTRAGFPYPYLATAEMLDLSADALLRRYSLHDRGIELSKIQAGDLLVYRGHVVMVEKVVELGRGDIVHATGGRDIKAPGQGIQRERYVNFGSYRGPLLRILRHKGLVSLTDPNSAWTRKLPKGRAASGGPALATPFSPK